VLLTAITGAFRDLLGKLGDLTELDGLPAVEMPPPVVP
jgi:hypothetical protein